MIGGLIWIVFAAAASSGISASTGAGWDSTGFGSGALEDGGRILEIGGKTDFGSVASADRLDFAGSISETDSCFGGASCFSGASAGAVADVSFDGLIAGSEDFALVSEGLLFFFGEIRSVAASGAAVFFGAGVSALAGDFLEGSFLLLARVAMNLLI
jgi:hypothetical protein